MVSPSRTLESAALAAPVQGQVFDLRFILTEAELTEGVVLLHPITGGSAKVWARLFCALCAAINLIAPTLNGTSWPELIRYAPAKAAIAGLGALVCACWAIWMKPLDHRLNRIDLERHIVLNEERVTITWNERTFKRGWKDFVYFRESWNVVILRNPGARFWTIPLRAVPPAGQPQFRELLCRKLARRQPYSWSPDSSGHAH